ncbi:Fic family protein [Mangrovimicrobium sediminis]|uniref:Protein adenylyltransferase n=1 Tax=Mangrovimicrobium sediminis TaxID=2562682 RepID=A0A4Z0LZF2_9GAMM|nr:Fic/DOC family N-terminal domain-containing protein [Haliea sp. SAOS-164]TGD72641.1 Fic family protein [Haliea sp. SAOS-164]
MDTSKFTDEQTGQLVTVPVSTGKDRAFVPNPLYPDWQIPQEIWALLADAKMALGRLDGVGRRLPNPELLLSPLRSREALRSSSLEGTYATPKELLLFELEPVVPATSGDKANAQLEVSNYGRALREGFNALQEYPLSLSLIRNLHQWLLEGVRGDDKSPGKFRETQVHIGSGRRFIPPPPTHLSQCLQELDAKLRPEEQGQREYDSLIMCYLLHYQFETIHPFRDGNGRVGRLILALTTWKWCGLSMPWLYMSPFFERYKDEYINNLFNVSARGDWSAWIEFCLKGTIVQAEDAIARCDALIYLRDDWIAKITQGNIRLVTLIDSLFTRPILTTTIVRQLTGVSQPTAQSDIDKLVEAQFLVPIDGTLRPVVYAAPQILDIAYGEPADI